MRYLLLMSMIFLKSCTGFQGVADDKLIKKDRC